MKEYLTPLLYLQVFFLPSIIGLLVWNSWLTVWRKDLAAGLALYLGLVIIVDGFLNTGIYISGMEKGSIRYSEVWAALLFFIRTGVYPAIPPRRLVVFLVFMYFTLLFLSVNWSDPENESIFEFRRLIIPQIVGFLLAKRGLKSDDDYRRFSFWLTTLSIIIGLFLFWDLFFDRWLLKSDMLYKPEYFFNRNQGRYGSFFLNPNYLGAFTVLVFPVAFVWVFNERKVFYRMFGLVGLLTIVFCLVETQSRGPLIAFGFSLLILLLGPCAEISRKRRLGYLALFFLILGIFMPGFLKHASKRFDSLDQEMTDSGDRTRQNNWEFAWRLIVDHPFEGIGFGEEQFIKAMDEYGFDEHFGESPLDNPHNSYLQAAVYAGVPAVAAFLLANGALIAWSLMALVRSTAGANSHIIFGLTVGISGFLLCIYPDMHLFTQTIAPVYWVFFGSLLSLTMRAPKANSSTEMIIPLKYNEEKT